MPAPLSVRVAEAPGLGVTDAPRAGAAKAPWGRQPRRRRCEGLHIAVCTFIILQQPRWRAAAAEVSVCGHSACAHTPQRSETMACLHFCESLDMILLFKLF